MLISTNAFRFAGASIRSTQRPQRKSTTVDSIKIKRNFGSQQA